MVLDRQIGEVDGADGEDTDGYDVILGSGTENESSRRSRREVIGAFQNVTRVTPLSLLS